MSMEALREFVANHTDRTACRCGRCPPATAAERHAIIGEDKSPWAVDAFYHTADMVFFDVSLVNNPNASTLTGLLNECIDELDLLDNKEHSYIEVGAWIGDQGLALQLMGLGWLLGLWQIMTPKLIGVDGDLAMNMAGAGYVSIIPHPAGKEIIYTCRM